VALPLVGSIFDRNGNDLAVSVARSSIWADPRVIDAPDAYATKLAPILGVDTIQLANDLGQKNRAFVYVARKVERDAVTKVRALALPGVGFVRDEAVLPAGDLLAPLLGFVGIDNNACGPRGGAGRSAQGQARPHGGRRDPQGRELLTASAGCRSRGRVTTCSSRSTSAAVRVERAVRGGRDRGEGVGLHPRRRRTGDPAMATVEGATPFAALPASSGTPTGR
jgi:hypothetical protein